MSDSSEGLFDCSEKPQVGFMQVDLKFRFCVRISLVDGIASVAPRRPEVGLEASVLVTDISPRFSRRTRLYRSKFLLSISDFLAFDREIPDWRAILLPSKGDVCE